jgi:hypothetical protein
MAKVAQSLFRMATDGNNVAAAISRMKARAGWRKKQHVELSSPDGGPLIVEYTRPAMQTFFEQWLPPRLNVGDRSLERAADTRRAIFAGPVRPRFNTHQRPMVGGEPD